VIDEETLAQINGKYAMPPDAGPAGIAAHEYGFDMSLVEASLKLTPEQRLAEHQPSHCVTRHFAECAFAV
jgi:hypothetical protein